MDTSPARARLPASCDLAQLGLRPGHIRSVEVVCRRRINTVYRICCGTQWHVLKWIEQPQRSVELPAYEMLTQAGVPVLPHRAAGQALLMEDLAHSKAWRLAEDVDMDREATGSAIAVWYRLFHQAGRDLLKTHPGVLGRLHCEAEKVTAAGVRSLSERLGLPASVIDRVAEQIEPVVQAVLRLPRTLNYNDFHWSNLALSRGGERRAIVFDYHLLGVGMAASDCRNAGTCLRGRARDGFFQTYGPVDERERVLDAPVATLHALLQAAESAGVPPWAGALMEQVRDGTLERQLYRARAAIRGFRDD